MAGCTIGVDLGGTKLLAGALAADGSVLAQERRLIGGLGLEELLDVTVRGGRARWAFEATPSGFGIPSLIDRRTGISVRCVHLPLDGVPFGALMADRLGIPVIVDNDANCAVVAEARVGAARGCSYVVLLTLGTGIGGGLVLDGELYRGAVGAGGGAGARPGGSRRAGVLRRLPRPRLPRGAVLGHGHRARRRHARRGGRAPGVRRGRVVALRCCTRWACGSAPGSRAWR